jgi:uncharacterized protein (TIGR00288 family)
MNERGDAAPNIAIFCDLENVAIGVREANFKEFDIEMVLERVLDKGNIITKKAYCDWSNYKKLKKPLHEAAFELIEIPHISYSGKNSADIRMVVDALDLAYSNEYVDLFVLLTGDSDFSPLVSKLRENNKRVVGIGVKHTSSDLLIENCDEYIYYDDLVRDKRSSGKGRQKRRNSKGGGSSKSNKSKGGSKSKGSSKSKGGNGGSHEGGPREEALEMVLDQVEALFRERDANVWASLVKQTLKRKRPNFSESYYGYRNFSHLLEDAESKGLLEIEKDQKSGGYIIMGFGPKA